MFIPLRRCNAPFSMPRWHIRLLSDDGTALPVGWRTGRRIVDVFPATLRMIGTRRLLQLVSTASVVTIITLIAVERISRFLISHGGRRVGRSRCAVVWLWLSVVALMVLLVVANWRLASEPARSVHGLHTTTATATIIDAGECQCDENEGDDDDD